MKKSFITKILAIASLIILLSGNTHAASKWGKGELKLDDYVVEKFIEYIKGSTTSKAPYLFAVSIDGWGYNYYYCPAGMNNCKGGDAQILEECSKYSKGVECKLFARNRTIKWKNGINTGKGKNSKINSKWSESEIRAKLSELGFLGSKSISSSNSTTSTNSQKKEKKVVKKYELKGERSIALSWEGYEELIAGTVKFDEVDYKGELNLSLPNNDGTCEGNYFLLNNGKGTWNISCTNNMGAAGTLKWKKNGGVTGSGRDLNDKKVKFTVSKQS